MRKVLLVASCWLLVASLFSAPVYAQNENELLPTGQTIDSDYIRAAQTIQINGDIHGDAFLSGGVITVNGNVDGDLFAAGGKIVLNGKVGNSVRAAGGDVTINGPVGRNVLLFCGNCSISKEASISGSLLVAGGNLEVNTPTVGKGFRFFGSRLYLNSIVNNEAYVVANQEFILGPQASISGDLKYTGNQEVQKEPGATVAGHIAYQKETAQEKYPRFFGAGAVLGTYENFKPATDLIGFIISAILGFILLGFFPKWFEKTTVALERRPMAALGWGIVAAVMVPVIAVLLAITLVGIPLSLLLLIVAYVGYVAAKFVVAFFVGRALLKGFVGERRGWAIVAGLFIFYLLGLVPVLGAVARLVITLFGVGAMILAYRQPILVEPQRNLEKYRTPVKQGRQRSQKQ